MASFAEQLHLARGLTAIIGGGGKTSLLYRLAEELAAQGSVSASEMLSTLGPAWYYNGLTVVGLLVASLLLFNSLFMLGRGIRAYRETHGGNVFGAARSQGEFARIAVDRAGFSSCSFERERPVEPDGTDIAEELIGRSFTAAVACARR